MRTPAARWWKPGWKRSGSRRAAPGSVAVHATEIYQEGLCLPLVKIVKAGKEDRELYSGWATGNG